MGSLSEAFWFCDEKKVPTEINMAHTYSYISKTKDLLKFRKAILKLRKECFNEENRDNKNSNN